MDKAQYIEALKRERGAVEVSHANAVERDRTDRAALLEQQLADIDAELAAAEGHSGKQTATSRASRETATKD